MGSFLYVTKLSEDAVEPQRAHVGDAGLDLFAAESVAYRPGETIIVKTGIAMAVPEGHVGMICDRSSMAAKSLAVGGGIIDSGYTGEVSIVLHNHADSHGCVQKGAKVAQLLIIPIARPVVWAVGRLPADPSSRGSGGFGSTGA